LDKNVDKNLVKQSKKIISKNNSFYDWKLSNNYITNINQSFNES
jgi:hypothetical protein